jgi:ribosomal protein S20
LAHSSRTWTGARTPQALKRVRQSARRNAILQPRRTAAKSQVKNALAAAEGGDVEATRKAVAEAASALDRAAKTGAIHPNNAARRKSRLMLRANAALGGESLTVTRKPQRQISKAAAAKAAKARIAASKASKAKGEQTAAGKARAALSKSARSSDTKKTAAKSTTSEASASKSTAKKTATKKTAAKKTAAKSTTKKTTAKKSTATKAKKTPAKKATKKEE